MKLYNTLTKKIDEVKPINPPVITVYTCGPTVYDYPHIGNWFTFIRYDILIRTLLASQYKVKWVMNITDVGHLTSDADEGEDKLATKAKKENKNAWDIANFYTEYFLKSLDKLNFIQPTLLPKATDHIIDQINFIKKLEAKGYTYKTNDGIYFNTALFKTYKDFARLDLDEQQANSRIDINPEKKNFADFALWKFSPKSTTRDMEWDSPWGKGFPGWHIECSAMCLKYLGETLDIHSGGIDHIPIHHTNEIAQSTALTGKPLANIWMHTNHILINDEKISKSLGNGITLEEIENKNINLMALRLLILESHYRSQSKFSWEALYAANNRLLRYINFAVRRYQPNTHSENKQTLDLITPLENDLNTPKALSNLEKFIDECENKPTNNETLIYAIKSINDYLGIDLNQINDISDELKSIINKREAARLNRNWQLADQLRDQLIANNITINDSEYGPIWQYLKI